MTKNELKRLENTKEATKASMNDIMELVKSYEKKRNVSRYKQADMAKDLNELSDKIKFHLVKASGILEKMFNEIPNESQRKKEEEFLPF